MQGGRSQRPGFHRPVGPSRVKVRRRLALAQSEPLGLQSRLGHLAPPQPPLGDALEAGALELVRLDATLGGGVSSKRSPGIGSVFPGVQTSDGDRSRYFSTFDQKHATVRR
jgi:hypothetical protein